MTIWIFKMLNKIKKNFKLEFPGAWEVTQQLKNTAYFCMEFKFSSQDP